MSDLKQTLLEQARSGRDYALPHVSEYAVGAAIRLADGTIGVGGNFENDNFTNTIHAEEAAFSDAMTNRDLQTEHPEITHVAVSTVETDVPEPCGHCKQTLTQYATADTTLILDTGEGYLTRAFTPQFKLPA